MHKGLGMGEFSGGCHDCSCCESGSHWGGDGCGHNHGGHSGDLHTTSCGHLRYETVQTQPMHTPGYDGRQANAQAFADLLSSITGDLTTAYDASRQRCR